MQKIDAAIATGAETFESSIQKADVAIIHACDRGEQAAAAGHSILPTANGLAALIGSKSVAAPEATAQTSSVRATTDFSSVCWGAGLASESTSVWTPAFRDFSGGRCLTP